MANSNLITAQYDSEGKQVFDPMQAEQGRQVVFAQVNPVTGKIEISTERSGIDSAVLAPRALFDVVPGKSTPTYVGTALGESGNYGRNLVEYTGDALNGTPSARIIVPYTGLKDQAGVALPNAGANLSIHGAKVLADGSVFFHIFCSDNNLNYLYLTNPTRTSCGANTGRNDNIAILGIGDRLGTHYANIRTTHMRSLGETVSNDGTRYVWVAEYNVATGRTSGSANDFVRVLRAPYTTAISSGVLGLTWETFLEWNTTGGQHYADHMHGIVQNPYTGWIYFMSGDDKSTGYDERFILAWDGVSAAPALATAPDQFSGAPGWKIIRGSELYRTVDILCYPKHIAWLCDCDTQAADATSDAFAAMLADPALTWASRVESIERIDNLPPAIACKTASGLSVFASFHGVNPASNEFWLWTSGSDGAHWRLAAKVKGYNTNSQSAVPWNLFEDPYTGKVLLCGSNAKGIQWLPSATTGYTYFFSLSRNNSDVQTFG